MKKYKLIKEYPGSPKLGFITSNEGSRMFYFKDHPEFWEEVAEKDYEILSFKRASGNYKGVIFTKTNQNTFNPSFRESNLTEEHCLKNDFDIYSVKRLSDGEIFTISDKIVCTFSKSESIITSFNIGENQKIKVNTKGVNFLGGDYFIDSIKHIKQSLFTTKDGVDIFRGDSYYNVHNFNICNKLVAINSLSEHEKLVFSTKKAAEEFILMNKPCLSINEILKESSTYLEERLKKLVKCKL